MSVIIIRGNEPPPRKTVIVFYYSYTTLFSPLHVIASTVLNSVRRPTGFENVLHSCAGAHGPNALYSGVPTPRGSRIFFFNIIVRCVVI